MGRIIAVNSNCYHGYSIEQAIDGIAAAGFRYIELTATKGWTEHVFPDQSFERLWQVKERLAEKGLTPFSMSGHCNLCLLYTSPSPRDMRRSRMPSSA